MNTFTFILSMVAVPLIMFGLGVAMILVPQKTDNGFLGYRTTRSKLSDDTWVFANRHCGKIWIVVSIVLYIVSFALCVPFWSADENTMQVTSIVAEGVQILVLALCFIPTETQLKKRFDSKGNPKE